MLAKVLLSNDQTRVEFLGHGENPPLFFSVIAPFCEAAFFEETLEQQFSSFRIHPYELFDFLLNDPFIQSRFKGPEWLIEYKESSESVDNSDFYRKNLGQKLLTAGIIDSSHLNALLDEFQYYSQSQRFGEFLKLKLDIPYQVLDLFLNTPSLPVEEFNGLKLGARLVRMGLVSKSILEEALAYQSNHPTKRLGDILVEKEAINPNLADFFSSIKINQTGEIIL